MIIPTAWYWHKNRPKKPKWNRTESPEITPNICSQLIFNKSQLIFNGGKTDSLLIGAKKTKTNKTNKTGHSHLKKKNQSNPS